MFFPCCYFTGVSRKTVLINMWFTWWRQDLNILLSLGNRLIVVISLIPILWWCETRIIQKLNCTLKISLAVKNTWCNRVQSMIHFFQNSFFPISDFLLNFLSFSRDKEDTKVFVAKNQTCVSTYDKFAFVKLSKL